MSENAPGARPLRVLFLCVHNSARSQMAEGMLRTWGGGHFEARSAGNEVAVVRPLAIRAMSEMGIDISGQRSKSVAEFAGESFDFAVTVCDDSKEACPYFPGSREHLNWPFDDPSVATGTDDARLQAFRKVRDEIAEQVRGLIAQHSGSG